MNRYRVSIVMAFAFCGAAAAADVPQTSSGQLEEVVVVAQKRSENLQNVPISVDAVSAVDLEHKGPVDITELRTLVPALNTTNTNGRLTMSLRGIGTTGVGPGVDNPIALYVDGVYFGSTVAGLLALDNVKQIEVLKGPQGTLFGRNATGGLVQVITKDPTSTPSGSLDFTYGNFQTEIGRFYVSDGKDGVFAADFAGYVKHQGLGWGTNLFDGRDIYNVDHDVALRSKWLFQPFEEGRITFIADYEDSHDTMLPFTRPPGTRSPFVAGLAPDLGWDTDTDWTPPHTVKSGGLNLRVDQDFANLKFASISAYRADRVYIGNDWDATPYDFASYYFIQHDHQFSQEFQLSSAPGRLTWTGGLYYYHESSNAPAVLRFAYLGFNAGLLGTELIDSEAVYGQGTYAITPSTNLTVGARYTGEQRKIQDAAFPVYPLFALGDSVPPPGPGSSFFPDARVSFNKPTYRIALDHRLSEQEMVYASFSTGFKSGGFSVYGPGAPPFQPETLDAYELGLKSDLLDRRVRLNAAVFDYEYKDIQVAQDVFGGYNTTNGGKARSYGIDLDLTAAVTSALHITAGLVVLEPKFTEYMGCALGVPGGGGPPPPGDCSGKLLPLASKATANLAADYLWALSSGDLDFNVNGYYNNGYYFEADNVIHQPSFGLFGANLRWTSRSSGLFLSAFGRNLGNKRTIAYGATQGTGAQELLWGEPRTYGLTVGYKF
jgi:iron complex outermembrane receptor protein